MSKNSQLRNVPDELHRLLKARPALRDLSDLPIERWPQTLLLPRLWDHRNNLTAYDAAYLALAEALDCPVPTRDARFAKAPQSLGRVALV
jgi:predicted nucleic acid-binding protein